MAIRPNLEELSKGIHQALLAHPEGLDRAELQTMLGANRMGT